MDQNNQTDFGGEIEQPIQCRILKAGHLAGDLCRDKLLVNGEFADARENSGKCLQHAPNMIGGVHVGRIEAGDHRIEARLLFLRKRLVGHRDTRVGERVVVERRVGIQVISRRAIAIDAIRPLLLKRNAKQRDASRLCLP